MNENIRRHDISKYINKDTYKKIGTRIKIDIYNIDKREKIKLIRINKRIKYINCAYKKNKRIRRRRYIRKIKIGNISNNNIFTGIKKLRKLAIGTWEYNENAQRFIKNYPECNKLTDSGIRRFKRIKSICLLYSKENRITDDGIKELKKIKKIDIDRGIKITDKSIKELKKIKILKCTENDNITNKGIKKLKNIKVLCCPYCKEITDERIKKLKKLKYLDCSNCEITDEGIKELKELEKLNCSFNEITDEGIKKLKKMKILDITECKKITDEGIKELKELRKLNCNYCKKITDEGIKEMKKLKILYCIKCNGITSIEVIKLENLQYIINYYSDIINTITELDKMGKFNEYKYINGELYRREKFKKPKGKYVRELKKLKSLCGVLSPSGRSLTVYELELEKFTQLQYIYSKYPHLKNLVINKKTNTRKRLAIINGNIRNIVAYG